MKLLHFCLIAGLFTGSIARTAEEEVIVQKNDKIPREIFIRINNTSSYPITISGFTLKRNPLTLADLSLEPGQSLNVTWKTRMSFRIDYRDPKTTPAQPEPTPWWKFWAGAPKTQAPVKYSYLVKIRTIQDERVTSAAISFSNPPEWFKWARSEPITADNLNLRVINKTPELDQERIADKETTKKSPDKQQSIKKEPLKKEEKAKKTGIFRK